MPEDATGREMGRPEPPPEASLIRLVRLGARLTTAEAARKAGVSKARWSQVENGHERKDGALRSVSASDGLLARMADAVGLSADRLDEAGRPDAADVVREMARRKEADQPGGDDELTPECEFEKRIMASDADEDQKRLIIRGHRKEGHSSWCRVGADSEKSARAALSA